MTDTTQQRPRPCAWAMRIPGCDGSADWVELGEQEPAPCPPAVAHPLYDQAEIDAAIERATASLRTMLAQMVAAERERCAKVCLSHSANGNFRADTREDCAALIRGEMD